MRLQHTYVHNIQHTNTAKAEHLVTNQTNIKQDTTPKTKTNKYHLSMVAVSTFSKAATIRTKEQTDFYHLAFIFPQAWNGE